MKLTPNTLQCAGFILEALDILGVVSNCCGYFNGIVLQRRHEQCPLKNLFSCFPHS
jgi:hypothetical protein